MCVIAYIDASHGNVERHSRIMQGNTRQRFIMSDVPASHTPGPIIGRRLRQLRQQRHFSLDQAARETGSSKAMLGQIERGESSPTVALLWRIATGLGVSLSYFLAADEPDTGSRHLPAGAEPWHTDSAGMCTRILLPYDAALRFEMLSVELAPGTRSQSPPHAPGTVEQIVMLEGELELQLADESHHISAGDTLTFAADQTHGYVNSAATAVRAHDLIHYAI